jgi:hypothetical protein
MPYYKLSLLAYPLHVGVRMHGSVSISAHRAFTGDNFCRAVKTFPRAGCTRVYFFKKIYSFFKKITHLTIIKMRTFLLRPFLSFLQRSVTYSVLPLLRVLPPFSGGGGGGG